ncbi:hypothetical protein SAMN05421881_101372 [Nitrosomonas halophila]|uniref:Uncharacterized protein n=1 Tax=Nitrosomonas halophila TaxID=44576 RepID=A0A1H3G030_9PROT|nr:hypothetical protein SAMN05421881_101372 [Nitrosomonas halophila]
MHGSVIKEKVPENIANFHRVKGRKGDASLCRIKE